MCKSIYKPTHVSNKWLTNTPRYKYARGENVSDLDILAYNVIAGVSSGIGEEMCVCICVSMCVFGWIHVFVCIYMYLCVYLCIYMGVCM